MGPSYYTVPALRTSLCVYNIQNLHKKRKQRKVQYQENFMPSTVQVNTLKTMVLIAGASRPDGSCGAEVAPVQQRRQNDKK